MGQKSKSVLEVILEWSNGRPPWQRDALRRIVVKGTLSEADYAELLALCKQAKGDTSTSVAAPLEAGHLPANPGAEKAVRLLSITDVDGVNQLASGQKLEFGVAGVTIVYGDNGAGKSGYARILKKACRARQAGEIVPNAYDPDAANKTPTARIGYAVGGVDQGSIKWNNSTKPNAVLSAVNVFDGDCAAVHVREKNEVAFRPFGLDIPDELAGACQKLKEALTAEQNDFTKACAPEFLKPTWHPETKVGKILSALSDKTKLAPLDELAKLSPDELERHRRLIEDLAKDPLKAVAEQEAAAQAVRRLRLILQQAGTANAEARLIDVKSKADDARAKRAAAKLAAEAAFSDDLLPGVGGEAWRVLWNSAKAYAETDAYVGKAFPTEDADARCVLCQQALDKDARARMHNFHKFVEADTEKLAAAAEKTFSQTVQAFKVGAISGKQTAADRRQVALRDAPLGRNALRYLASIRLRRRKCIAALSGGAELILPDLAADPADDLQKLEENLTTYAAELRTAANVDGRKKLQHECNELSDRIALSSLQAVAKEEVDRLKKLKLIGDCLKDTATAAITNLGNDIADSAITPQIRDRFQQEIVQLAGSRIRVEIVRSGGKFGSPQYQVRLYANPQTKVHTVLSEGEQTCVALAAFLTELATATHASSLVFDDPVSSLDHRWRKQVANRLVAEAKVRQIIVFTHDIVFVNDLLDKASELKVPHSAVTVAKGTDGAGTVSEGLPWAAAKVEDRLDKLEKEAREARKAYDGNDDDGYSKQVHDIYERLRSTWERAIEQVVFHRVVLRHRDYIDTKHLRKAAVLTDADCDQFAAGYKKCSDQVEAHDPSGARNAAPPAPDEVLTDIQALGTWVKSIRDRQKGIS